jgi:hypothetical protein
MIHANAVPLRQAVPKYVVGFVGEKLESAGEKLAPGKSSAVWQYFHGMIMTTMVTAKTLSGLTQTMNALADDG